MLFPIRFAAKGSVLMSFDRARLGIGIMAFLAGGAILAFVDASWGTGAGTACGVMGLGLVVWAFLSGERDE